MNYPKLVNRFGKLYHLLYPIEGEAPKFLKEHHEYFAGCQGRPIYLDTDTKQIRIALEYTILVPKIFVTKSIPYELKYGMHKLFMQ